VSKYLLEKDFKSGYLKWLNKLALYTKEKPEDLELLQNEIVRDNDCALAYYFTAQFNYKPHRMQKVILDQKDAKYAFLFAQNIPNCDIKALQQVVINSKDIKYICNFACFVKDANHKPFERIILNSKNIKKNTQYIHKYLKHVEKANVNKFKDIILGSGKPRYLFELAKRLKNPEDIAYIEEQIIQSGSFRYMRLFAEEIEASNIEKIEQAVLDSDNVNEIKKFAKYVRRSRMKRFFLVL